MQRLSAWQAEGAALVRSGGDGNRGRAICRYQLTHGEAASTIRRASTITTFKPQNALSALRFGHKTFEAGRRARTQKKTHWGRRRRRLLAAGQTKQSEIKADTQAKKPKARLGGGMPCRRAAARQQRKKQKKSKSKLNEMPHTPTTKNSLSLLPKHYHNLHSLSSSSHPLVLLPPVTSHLPSHTASMMSRRCGGT